MSSTYYDELHMNWGWGDDNNGSDTWTANFTATDGSLYNRFVQMITDIKPEN